MVAERVRVAVIGGGILGLAHALGAARRGHRVSLFERSSKATGASIRNFGMIWPVGQPAGEMHSMALRSREIWMNVLERTRLPYHATGSLHLAYKDDEANVLQEFADIGPREGYDCRWLDAGSTLDRSAAVQGQGLKGALWSGAELTIDPRPVVSRLAEYLREMNVFVCFGTTVIRILLPRLETSAGHHEVDAAIVCSGDDFETLFPEAFQNSGITRCKLQMMRTAPQPRGWELGPSLAAGLTLRFYKAFQICSSLPKLKARIAAEMPDYERYLIHVLVSQTADGAVTVGDSHEYGSCVDIFDKSEIDELILREAKAFLQLPEFQIAQHWHGVYSTHPDKPFFTTDPCLGVRIVTGVGGSGMTLSFGLAERTLDEMGL